MELQLSMKATVIQYLLDNENVPLSGETLIKDTGVTMSQLSNVMHALCRDTDSLIKLGRSKWIYNPTEPVKAEVPPVHRLHDLLQKKDMSSDAIAEELGIPRKKVSSLIVRLHRELGVQAHSSLIYSIKEPTDETSNSTN